MIRAFRFWVAAALLAVGPASMAAVALSELPDFTKLVQANSAAVVNISTTIKSSASGAYGRMPGGPMPDLPEDSPLNEFFRRFFGEPPSGNPHDPHGPRGPEGLEQSSLGSGFIISKDGYVISNYHVVKDADEIIVKLSDRREYTAEIVGTDPRSDIAVLKVKANDDLPTLKLGNSEALQVGEWVLAIGSPFGFDHSVTAGIVSAKGRSLPNENYVPFIQTDVAINPGNSGGPLFNLDGEVVGVNSQIYSRTGGFMGLSFAIPIDVVMNVYSQIKDKGQVSRGWLGVLIQDVTRELAESFNMDKTDGALVSKVLPGGPADRSGVAAGDIIVKFNRQRVSVSADLPPLVGRTAAGEKVPVEVMRGGKTKKLTVTIGELPTEDEPVVAKTEDAPETSNTRLKLTVVDLTASQRQQLDVTDHGVLVEAVDEGAGYDAGIRTGDVILQINHQKVKNVEKFTALVEGLTPGKRVPVLIQRHGGSQFIALKLPE